MLNTKQQEAVNFKNGQMLVVSCPGSGKTTVIVARVHQLIESGVNPSNILIITFTKEAADQMQKRYEKKYGPTQAFFGTIHSICFRVLAKAYNYTKEDILRANEQWEFMFNFLCKKVSSTDLQEYIKNMIAEIGYVRNKGMDYRKYQPEHSEKDIFRATYQAYDEFKKEKNKIDFDDMLVICQKCFREDKENLQYWKNQYAYIMIDEFQDTNSIQADIFYMLAGPDGNLFVVGDDDQSIYKFRSADSSIMLDFPKTFPKCQTIYMDTNYRSGTEVIKYAGNLIRVNKKRFEKDFHGFRKEPGSVSAIACNGPNEEVDRILKDMDSLRKQGVKYTDMAVLYRTNMENQLLAGKLLKLKVPFYTTEAIKDYHEDFIFQDIMAYYRIACRNERKGDLQRILNRPSRFLKAEPFKNCSFSKADLFEACKKLGSDKSVQAMSKINELLYDIDMLKKQTVPYGFVQSLLSMGYMTFIGKFCEFSGRDQETCMQTLNLLLEEAKEQGSMEEWQAYAKFYSESLQQKKRDKRKDGVCLSTFHSAKGLEWSRVYILNADDGNCPYKKSDDIEEERRLFYVAVTRAKDVCKIFYSGSNGKKKQIPSQFLYEMGLLNTGAKIIKPIIY